MSAAPMPRATRMKGAAPRGERGLVLVSSLLLLLVVTILAVSMFRSFGIEEKIAGNVRDKQRALHAAESAQQYAEWWLSAGNNNIQVACSQLLNADQGQGQVCTNSLNSLAASGNIVDVPLPWSINGGPVGVQYTPVDPMTGNPIIVGGTGANNYSQAPVFYISYLGLTGAGTTSMFQIDAVGYGGSSKSVAIVESTYQISTAVKDLGGA